MGFYQGGANALRLSEEFHHKRINPVCSHSLVAIEGKEGTYRLLWTFQQQKHLPMGALSGM